MKEVSKFLQALATTAVAKPDGRKVLSGASSLVALAIAGRAIKEGDFPVALTKNDIQQATGCHHMTVKDSIDLLVNAGFIHVTEGKYRSGGSHEMLISCGKLDAVLS